MNLEINPLDTIVTQVCKLYNIPIEFIYENRKKESVEPRQVAMYIARKLTSYSFAKIGAFFKKDHATVMHACKAVDNLSFCNEKFTLKVSEILFLCGIKINERKEFEKNHIHQRDMGDGKKIIFIGYSKSEIDKYNWNGSR